MSPPLDYIAVGAGIFGSVFARCAAEAGKRVLVVDRRPHIAGNCYSRNVDGIDVHQYGPHIFHTNNRRVWEFVNRFAEFNHYRHRGVVRHGDRLFSFPINLTTLHQLWGAMTPEEARRRLQRACASERAGTSERAGASPPPANNSENLESWIINQIGRELYEIFVRGYTTKQWGRDPRELPASIIKRIPIRLTWDDNYFDDQYQGIPTGGYTRLFENLLDHPNISVETGVDFFAHRRELERNGARLVYSGKIDEFFDYRFGQLEYRSLRFETASLKGDFQGTSIVNYGEASVPYTRVVEHKHFAMQSTENTVLTYEYPQKYESGREAFYPIRDECNTATYEKYRQLSQSVDVIFGGRLGSYQYFDMHQVFGQALAVAERELAGERRTAA